MARRVVFDTNVLVSGVLYRGRPHLCLRMASEGVVQSVTSEFILEEFTRILAERFHFSRERAEQAAALIRNFSDVARVSGEVQGVCRDPDDDHVLDCAVAGGADVVVSGDKDLLALSPFTLSGRAPTKRVEILPPSEFISMLKTPD